MEEFKDWDDFYWAIYRVIKYRCEESGGVTDDIGCTISLSVEDNGDSYLYYEVQDYDVYDDDGVMCICYDDDDDVKKNGYKVVDSGYLYIEPYDTDDKDETYDAISHLTYRIVDICDEY